MCFCLDSVCQFVNSDISGTRRRSATLLLYTPSWKALPGKLRRLRLECTGRVVREEKCLELFRRLRMKPRPSHYNGAIVKKLVVFMKRVELFLLHLGSRKVEQCFQCVGSFAKAEWKLWRSGN